MEGMGRERKQREAAGGKGEATYLLPSSFSCSARADAMVGHGVSQSPSHSVRQIGTVRQRWIWWGEFEMESRLVA